MTNYYLFNDAESLFYFFIGEQDYYERLYTPVQLIDGLYETKFNKSFALLSAWGNFINVPCLMSYNFQRIRLERTIS